MSEEQGKPTGNPRDLVSVIIFFIMLIVILTVIVSVLGEGGTTVEPLSWSYNAAKDDIQNAVTADQTDHNELIPTLSSTYTNANCSNCSVINISASLVENDGLLASTPDGLHLSASGNDNCGGNASLGCVNGWHYIWLVDDDGEVFSYCAGAGCTTNNSGYQDVWP
jgi:hypothetical protein